MREVLAAHDNPAIPPLLALADRTAERHRSQYRAVRRLGEALPGVVGRDIPIARMYQVPHVPTREDLVEMARHLDDLLVRGEAVAQVAS